LFGELERQRKKEGEREKRREAERFILRIDL
jgi:hypothetical protein